MNAALATTVFVFLILPLVACGFIELLDFEWLEPRRVTFFISQNFKFIIELADNKSENSGRLDRHLAELFDSILILLSKCASVSRLGCQGEMVM